MKRTPTPVLDLVLDALATYRLTRLVTTDVLTQPVREEVIAWAYTRADVDYVLRAAGQPDQWQTLVADDPDPPRLAYLVTCPWCAGVYVAAGVVVARALVPRAWRPVARGAALAALGALTALTEGALDRVVHE